VQQAGMPAQAQGAVFAAYGGQLLQQVMGLQANQQQAAPGIPGIPINHEMAAAAAAAAGAAAAAFMPPQQQQMAQQMQMVPAALAAAVNNNNNDNENDDDMFRDMMAGAAQNLQARRDEMDRGGN
jgi:hypothetical protein